MMRIAAVVAIAHLVLIAGLMVMGGVNATRLLPMALVFEQGSVAAVQKSGASPPSSRASSSAEKKTPINESPAQHVANAPSDTSSMPPATASVGRESVVSISTVAASDASSASGGTTPKAQGADDRQPMVDATFTGNRLPEYPAMSRRLGEQGTVMLRVMIGADGRAGDVQLVRSSGSDRLDQSAIQTIRQWRFVPALKGGKPVSAWYEWQWEFRLSS